MSVMVSIPEELYDKAVEIAEPQHVTVDEVFASAFVEQLAAWERLKKRVTLPYLDQRRLHFPALGRRARPALLLPPLRCRMRQLADQHFSVQRLGSLVGRESSEAADLVALKV